MVGHGLGAALIDRTDQFDDLLGFDLSGQQAKAAKAAGENMSTRITKSPMVLVGGGTGGGKAMAVGELTAVIRRKRLTAREQ